jgi:RNA polymerase sigma-70 factor (ECF subfamily)
VTDEQLIADALRGSKEAFEELFDRYRQSVWAFFRRRTTDPGVTEELAQDTFVALMQGAVRYEARATFRTYLFGIAYHVLQRSRRATRHRTAEMLEVDSPDVRGADPDAVLWVRHAIERLDETDREILMLREYEELSYHEIANLRKLPLNTVRSRLFRARMALKAALVPERPSVRAER